MLSTTRTSSGALVDRSDNPNAFMASGIAFGEAVSSNRIAGAGNVTPAATADLIIAAVKSSGISSTAMLKTAH